MAKEKEIENKKSVNKKLIPFYTLEILKEYSDENHMLSQVDIINKIEKKFGKQFERKSIGSSIKLLQWWGYDVRSVQKKGTYLGERTFTNSEIRYIVDAMFSSKSISSKDAKEIVSKLTEELSIYQKKEYNIINANTINDDVDVTLFNSIDILSEAISKRKRVNFDYPTINGVVTYQHVSPFKMMNSDGKYYLVCATSRYKELRNFRIDLMSKITFFDGEKAISIKDMYEAGTLNSERMDWEKYKKEHFYMFGGKTVNAMIRVNSEKALNYVYEHFSKKDVRKRDEKTVFVTANENALAHWAIQYGEYIEIMDTSARDRVKELLASLNEKYK